jgi:hypothetical protein
VLITISSNADIRQLMPTAPQKEIVRGWRVCNKRKKKAASAEQKTSALFSLGWLHFTTAQRFRSSSEIKRLGAHVVSANFSHKSAAPWINS